MSDPRRLKAGVKGHEKLLEDEVKKMFGTWTKQAVFGMVSLTVPDKSLDERGKDVVVEKGQSSTTHFMLMLQEKSYRKVCKTSVLQALKGQNASV